MIQLDKRWNIKLGSWICLGDLVLWSLQAIVQIVRNGALSAPVIQVVGFAFFVFGTAFGTFTDEDNRIPVYGVVLSSLLPLPVVARMIIMGLH
ncbi:hypothetical protein [Bifidobacterium pseudolongum]|uniref:Uncharacterized protein n=1 Tax=Bifidobacterium pseudolongum subsp. globosum TaxID=1690 RepID=A0A2N3R8K3_9BIFI|nr:hypothetical protein [Bifidobacterium pseudolongum]PKV05684.1 hypothetical protein CQR50_0940 [Bifidobacterium pseudolongum subsp. globosum]